MARKPKQEKRPGHPRKDLEAMMREAEAHGWTFDRRRKAYQGFCSCGVHTETVRMTPSGANYAVNKLKQVQRTCWEQS
jgi:hypothetical protein